MRRGGGRGSWVELQRGRRRPLGARGWKGGGLVRRTVCPSGRGARCAGRGVRAATPREGRPRRGPSRRGRARGADAPGGSGLGRSRGRSVPAARALALALAGSTRSPRRRGRACPGPDCGLGAAEPPSAYRGGLTARGFGRGAWAAAGGRRAAGRGRRRGRGRWRSRGGRSSLFVFVARWLPASYHVTRTRGRGAAPSAAAAATASSLRGSGPLGPARPRALPACPAGTVRTPAAPELPPPHVTREPGLSRDVGAAAGRCVCGGVFPLYSATIPRT